MRNGITDWVRREIERSQNLARELNCAATSPVARVIDELRATERERMRAFERFASATVISDRQQRTLLEEFERSAAAVEPSGHRAAHNSASIADSIRASQDSNALDELTQWSAAAGLTDQLQRAQRRASEILGEYEWMNELNAIAAHPEWAHAARNMSQVASQAMTQFETLTRDLAWLQPAELRSVANAQHRLLAIVDELSVAYAFDFDDGSEDERDDERGTDVEAQADAVVEEEVRVPTQYIELATELWAVTVQLRVLCGIRGMPLEMDADLIRLVDQLGAAAAKFLVLHPRYSTRIAPIVDRVERAIETGACFNDQLSQFRHQVLDDLEDLNQILNELREPY